MPDATGLELLAQELGEQDPDGVLGTVFFRERATLLVSPRFVPAAPTVIPRPSCGPCLASR